MKTIGLMKALALCSQYRNASPERRAAIQEQRLRELVNYARAHSPYYARLYAGVPEDFRLSDLPPVNKRELMGHWDHWVTDPSVTLEQINGFLANKDNIGRKWQGKYMVVTTSGSTGNPLVMLCDNTVNNVMAAVSATRSYARKEDLRAFVRRGGKSMGVFADGGFYLANSSIRARLLRMPWKKRQLGISSALYPTEQIVEQLNRFQLLKFPQNRMELRLEPMEGTGKEQAFAEAAKALRALLSVYGVHSFDLSLSEDTPRQHPVSGKFKHVINV